jgi:hypothetical protein
MPFILENPRDIEITGYFSETFVPLIANTMRMRLSLNPRGQYLELR